MQWTLWAYNLVNLEIKAALSHYLFHCFCWFLKFEIALVFVVVGIFFPPPSSSLITTLVDYIHVGRNCVLPWLCQICWVINARWTRANEAAAVWPLRLFTWLGPDICRWPVWSLWRPKMCVVSLPSFIFCHALLDIYEKKSHRNMSPVLGKEKVLLIAQKVLL